MPRHRRPIPASLPSPPSRPSPRDESQLLRHRYIKDKGSGFARGRRPAPKRGAPSPLRQEERRPWRAPDRQPGARSLTVHGFETSPPRTLSLTRASPAHPPARPLPPTARALSGPPSPPGSPPPSRRGRAPHSGCPSCGGPVCVGKAVFAAKQSAGMLLRGASLSMSRGARRRGLERSAESERGCAAHLAHGGLGVLRRGKLDKGHTSRPAAEWWRVGSDYCCGKLRAARIHRPTDSQSAREDGRRADAPLNGGDNVDAIVDERRYVKRSVVKECDDVVLGGAEGQPAHLEHASVHLARRLR